MLARRSEISGAGGFVALASQRLTSTPTFRYALDFGATWRQCAVALPSALAAHSVSVVNIMTRSFAAQSFLLYGASANSRSVVRVASRRVARI